MKGYDGGLPQYHPPVLRWLFGARGQLAVGALTFAGAVAAWVYGSGLAGEALVRFIFRASMAALVVAAYAIVATALGYRATERVESAQQAELERREPDLGPEYDPPDG